MALALRGVAQLLIGNTAFALPMLLDRRIAGVTALVGLVVTMPAIGHAAWHAYRETIDPAAWPAYPGRALPVASRWRAAASSTRE